MSMELFREALNALEVFGVHCHPLCVQYEDGTCACGFDDVVKKLYRAIGEERLPEDRPESIHPWGEFVDNYLDAIEASPFHYKHYRHIREPLTPTEVPR